MHAELIFTGQGAEGRRVPLFTGQPYVLGRSRSADIVVTGPKISRQHVTLRFDGQSLSLTDEGSRNGTFLRGQRLQPRLEATLTNGETFKVGDSVLVLRDLGEESQASRAIQGPWLPGYETVASIGNGAYSRVFSAIHKATGQMVAIKSLTATEDDELQRFEREGRIMSELDHPNLVKVLEYIVEGSTPHIVMEFVDGRTARQAADEVGLPLGVAITHARDLCAGLVRLHEAGVVHRDVKPSNVLLPYAGGLKLTDLGIAKATDDSDLTSEGQGLGTFGYMPPEQALNARGVDSRSDLYGLGATVYHLLVGRAPFRFGAIRGQEDLRQAVTTLRTRQPVPPSVHRPDTPSWLDVLVMQLLSKEPSARGDPGDVLATFARWAKAFEAGADEHDTLGETWV